MSQSRSAKTLTFCLECSAVMVCVTTVPASGLHPEILGYECPSCEHGLSTVEAPAKLSALVGALLKRRPVIPPPVEASQSSEFADVLKWPFTCR
jgi:hypothetical protein